MEVIRISNVITEGKTPLDYYDNKNYKKFGIHVGTSSLVPVYQELLREVIGDKVDEVFKDYVLSAEEISQIQMVFERELDVKINERKLTEKTPHKDIVYKGKSYALDLRLTSPIDRRINDYFTIMEICKECLEEDKPMYLSIE